MSENGTVYVVFDEAGNAIDSFPGAKWDALLAENARLREAGQLLADAVRYWNTSQSDMDRAALSAWREAVGQEQ